MKNIVRTILLCVLASSISLSATAQRRSRSQLQGKAIVPAASDWKFPAPNMKVKQDSADNTTYLLGKDEQGRSYYATRIKSDGRDAVMVKMPDNLYPNIKKTVEGDAPDYVLASIAFSYACHPKSANTAASYIASAHPEYRFHTRSGRTAHVVTGRDKTIVMIWIEPLARRGKRR